MEFMSHLPQRQLHRDGDRGRRSRCGRRHRSCASISRKLERVEARKPERSSQKETLIRQAPIPNSSMVYLRVSIPCLLLLFRVFVKKTNLSRTPVINHMFAFAFPRFCEWVRVWNNPPSLLREAPFRCRSATIVCSALARLLTALRLTAMVRNGSFSPFLCLVVHGFSSGCGRTVNVLFVKGLRRLCC